MVAQVPSGAGAGLRIPATVRIGGMGHRKLGDQQRLRARVREVLRDLDDRLRQTPHVFVVLSPLAEGADRLVAEEVLNWAVTGGGSPPRLEVVLPLPEAEYLQDFDPQESKDAFHALLARAHSVETLPPAPSRTAAYEQVGRYVVDHCQVLIALWDGRPATGQGGTAEIVEYAREIERPLCWIDARTGRITREHERRGILEALAQLDAYNSERVSQPEVDAARQAHYAALAQNGQDAGLDPAVLEPLQRSLLPHFARADWLVRYYQSRYTKAGSAIYILAAAAVAVVAVQTLFLAGSLYWIFLEVAAMLAALFLLGASQHGEWHRKWADYRFLAERLRVAPVFWLMGMDCGLSDATAWATPYYQPDDPMVIAFNWIWSQRPRTGPACEHLPFEPLKKFLLSAWIDDQRAFYDKTGRKHERRYSRLAWGGYAVFLLTLIASALHASGVGHPPAGESYLPNVLIAAGLILPAVGAALAGIRSHREYQRHSDRYGKMAHTLSRLSRRIKDSTDIGSLSRLVAEANSVMLNEHEDWRLTVGIHTPEP